MRRRELIDALRRGLSVGFPGLGRAETGNQAALTGENAQTPAGEIVQVPGDMQGPAEVNSETTADTASDAAVAAGERLLAAGDLAGLSRLGPELVPALERIALEFHRPLPEAVYSEVLARTDPVFAALGQLASGELRERRTGPSGPGRAVAAIGPRTPGPTGHR